MHFTLRKFIQQKRNQNRRIGAWKCYFLPFSFVILAHHCMDPELYVYLPCFVKEAGNLHVTLDSVWVPILGTPFNRS